MSAPVVPQAVFRGLTFFPIPRVDGVTSAFGQSEAAFFPRRDLPDVPRAHKNAAMDLFYSGGQLPDMDPRVDREKATTFLGSLLASFAPAHEAKEATAGYALWVWSSPAAIDAALSEQPVMP